VHSVDGLKSNGCSPRRDGVCFKFCFCKSTLNCVFCIENSLRKHILNTSIKFSESHDKACCIYSKSRTGQYEP